MKRLALAAVVLFLASCLDFEASEKSYCDQHPEVCGGTGPDGGPTGGGTGGSPDGGPFDAGPADAGASDAGTTDAGGDDAGAPDAGAPDAGSPDSGVDAGGLPGVVPNWVRALGPFSSGDLQFVSLDPGLNGGVWVSGQFTGSLIVDGGLPPNLDSTPTTSPDALFVHYAADGRPDRYFRLGTTINSPTTPDNGKFAFDDHQGRTWVALDVGGAFASAPDASFNPLPAGGSGTGAAIIRYAPTGDLDLLIGFTSSSNSRVSLQAGRELTSGGVALTGYSNGYAGSPCSGLNGAGNATFVARLSSTGACPQLLLAQCNNNLQPTLYDEVVVPATQDIIAVGLAALPTATTSTCTVNGASGTAVSQNSPALYRLPGSGGAGVGNYLTALAPNLKPLYLASFGSRVFLAGSFSGSKTVSGSSYASNGATDVFLGEIYVAGLDFQQFRVLGGAGADEVIGLSAGDAGLELTLKTAGGFSLGSSGGSVPAAPVGSLLTVVLDYDPGTSAFTNPPVIPPFSGVALKAVGTTEGNLFVAGLFDGGVTFPPDASVLPVSAGKPNVFVGRLAR